MANTFTDADLAQLDARDVSRDEAEAQLALLRTPPAPIVLDRPCTTGDGILQIDPEAEPVLLERADEASATGRLMKFVPASGAASRMFRDVLLASQDAARPSATADVQRLFERLDDLAFAAAVRAASGVEGAPASDAEERALLRALVEAPGYARLPKALVPFHHAGTPRTAFEEHLLDATRYLCRTDGRCRLHLTVPDGLRPDFEAALDEALARIEALAPGARLDVTFSEQHPATDTLAVTPDGTVVRMADGALLFRPGGHGALLRNLAESGADVAVIKNIDNILPFERSADHARWKRLLIGTLAQIQQEAFALLRACLPGNTPLAVLERAAAYAEARFARRPTQPLDDADALRAFVIDALDRPLRVCGVVRNDGEPGGAPFWVRDAEGRASLQIVESSQVDAAHPGQADIFRAATHFNPVDLVCGLRTWTGRAYDLDRFVDRSAVFLSRKSHEGRDLIALERPGLWNGAMAGWNTVFVEVPAHTFAPVKTVFDLLRPEHQL